jgi:hypothetical protein
MAQTRAISRVCRSAFAHVVVMMNANLSTTPAEEMDFAQPVEEVIEQPAPAPAPEPRRSAQYAPPRREPPRQDIPAPDHPYAPRQERAEARQEPARVPAAPRPERPSAASTRGYAPQPTRHVNRTGSRVPAPHGELSQDWQRWFRAISRRVEAAGTRDEVMNIANVHAADVARGAAIIDGAATALHEEVEARLKELNGKAA